MQSKDKIIFHIGDHTCKKVLFLANLNKSTWNHSCFSITKDNVVIQISSFLVSFENICCGYSLERLNETIQMSPTTYVLLYKQG